MVAGDAFTGDARFEVQKRLGEGGFGTVYAAFDRELRIPVALKRLRQSNADALYRFKQEFRSLAGVVHPNLVSLYELFQANEQWYFTMELVQGRHLFDYLRPGQRVSAHDVTAPAVQTRGGVRPTPPPDLQAVRRAFQQLALRALHASGLLHRDVKPSNVLVTEEGRVVVLDFGLVTQVRAKETEVVGTPHYMAPEQWLGGDVGEAADWYSVGVALYEALTGVTPYDGTASEIAHEKLEHSPPPPAQLSPDIPDDLSTLCQDLLRLVPRERPSGDEVLRRLGADPHREIVHEVRGRAFVGRGDELAALHEAARTAAAGHAVTVHLVGESGLGKTALAEQFIAELSAERHDAVVLRGRSYAQESLPYKALDGAIDDLCRFLGRLGAHDLFPLLPNDVPDLACLFPVLRRVSVIARMQRPADASAVETRRRGFGALRELVERIASVRPLVLFLDDAHWGDVDSAALLDRLTTPPSPPLLIVLAYRPDEERGSAFLRELRVRAELTGGERGQLRRVTLGSLGAEECEGLARSLLAHRRSDAPPHLSRIVREAGGNPLFVEELVRYSQVGDDEALQPGPKRELDSAARNALLRGVIERRLSELPEAWRRLMEVVAISGLPIDVEAARRAAGLEGLDGTLLNRLRAGHLVRTRPADGREQIAAYHDRIRDIVVGGIDGPRRRALHSGLADALISVGRAPPAVVATHLHDAGELERAADFALEAAERADAALAFEEAAELYRKVLDWKPGDSARTRTLRRRHADALANAGRCLDAAPVYLEAAQSAARLDRMHMERLAFEQYMMGGSTDEGLQILSRLCKSLDLSFPSTHTRSFISLATEFIRLQLRGISYKERDEAQIAPLQLCRIDVSYSAGRALSFHDPMLAAFFRSRALRLALAAGEPSRLVEGLSATGMGLVMTGRNGLAMLEAARRLAEQLGTPYARGLFLLWSAFIDHHECRWDASLRAWDEAVSLLRQCRGVTSEIQKAQLNAILAVQLLGRFDELQSRCDRALADGRATGNRYTEDYARLYSAIGRLAMGDLEGARSRISEARARAPRGDHYIGATALKFECNCDLYEGRAPDALQRLDRAWPELVGTRMMRIPQFVVAFHGLRAAVAIEVVAHHGGERRLLAQAEDDQRKVAKAKYPFAVGRAAMLQAAIALARGDGAVARTRLEEAARAFSGPSLALEAAYARRWLGRLTPGDEGEALVVEADQVMRARSVADPERWSRSQAPGFRVGR